MKVFTAVILLLLFLIGWTFYYGLESAYEAGYKRGQKDCNIWWVDQKSTYKDTKSVLEKHRKEGWDNV